IALEKRAQLVDTNGNGTADVGEVIEYTIVATNTGNVMLHDVQLDDPLFGPGELTPAAGYASLRPGEQGVFRGAYTVQQPDVDTGFVRNTATVEAEDPWGGSLGDDATVDVATTSADSALSLAKTST